MEKSKTFNDIIHGQSVGFTELRPAEYWDTYEALRHGYFKGQYRFNMPEIGIIGDLELTALHPQPEPLTLDQEYLLVTPEKTRRNHGA